MGSILGARWSGNYYPRLPLGQKQTNKQTTCISVSWIFQPLESAFEMGQYCHCCPPLPPNLLLLNFLSWMLLLM